MTGCVVVVLLGSSSGIFSSGSLLSVVSTPDNESCVKGDGMMDVSHYKSLPFDSIVLQQT